MQYNRAEQALGIVELGGLMLSVVAYLRYLTVKGKYHKRVFDQFVEDNDWTEQKESGMAKVATSLLSVAESYEQGFGFEGTYAGRPFNCLIFDYLATSSDTRRFICLSFELSKAYPMILIDNKLNNHKIFHDTDPLERIPKGVELSLEGDFNQYYQTSTTKGKEREALIVLSPEFMAALEDSASEKVDIEIGNKRLFLVYEADYYSEQNITSLFKVADVVLGKFNKLSETWLASSQSLENAIGQEAETNRHKMIFRLDWVTMIFALVFSIIGIVLLISHVETEPSCMASAPCYPTRTYRGY
jgi:hypothetical protein